MKSSPAAGAILTVCASDRRSRHVLLRLRLSRGTKSKAVFKAHFRKNLYIRTDEGLVVCLLGGRNALVQCQHSYYLSIQAVLTQCPYPCQRAMPPPPQGTPRAHPHGDTGRALHCGILLGVPQPPTADKGGTGGSVLALSAHCAC